MLNVPDELAVSPQGYRYMTDPVFVVTGDTIADVMLEIELGIRVVMHLAWETTYSPGTNINFMLTYNAGAYGRHS